MIRYRVFAGRFESRLEPCGFSDVLGVPPELAEPESSFAGVVERLFISETDDCPLLSAIAAVPLVNSPF